MGVWGKLGGAGIGFALGGPLGALMGGLAGHYAFDSDDALFAPAPDLVFSTGLVALAAKMAKADGVVTHDEVAAFRRVVEVAPDEVDRVRKLFDLAKETPLGFEAYAAQMAELLADRPDLLEDVLDGLFEIAKADHAIHEAELRYFRCVGAIFGFDEAAMDRIEARHVLRKDDPWRVLGADRGMSDDALRALRRRLVIEHHPDRHIAAGLPPEAVKIAGDRLAAINAAWEKVAAERRLDRTP